MPVHYCISAVIKIRRIAKINGVTRKRNIERRTPFKGTDNLGLSVLDEKSIFALTDMLEKIMP
jgi:hypothetical protein